MINALEILGEAMGLLTTAPDFVLVPGHGLAHPRRFGLACHVGVLTGIPTIGCAKSLLVGTHDPPEQEKGEYAASLSFHRRPGGPRCGIEMDDGMLCRIPTPGAPTTGAPGDQRLEQRIAR